MSLLANHGIIGGGFDPLSTNPDWWIDGFDTSKYVSTVDNLGKIADSITTKGTNAYVMTAIGSGALRRKLSYNGEGFYSNQVSGTEFGSPLSSSSFNTLHNGTAFTMYYQWFQVPHIQQTNPYPVLGDIGTS